MVIRIVNYKSIRTEWLVLLKEHPTEERIILFWRLLKWLFYKHRAEAAPPPPPSSSSTFFFFLNFQGNQKLGLWPCAFLLSAWILFLNPNNQRSVSKLDHFRLSQLVLCGFKNMLIWSYILLASFIHLFGLSSKNAHNLSIERRHLYFQFTPFIIRRVFEIKPKSITLVF